MWAGTVMEASLEEAGHTVSVDEQTGTLDSRA